MKNKTKWLQRSCIVCHETWPTRTSLQVPQHAYICIRCKHDKDSPKLFSQENDMHPGKVPVVLQGLTQIEEMLIARACPIMCVYRNMEVNMDTKVMY